MTDIKTWIKNFDPTLAGFLVLQAIAIVAYAVKLETRVSTMETRGAEFTVSRMDRIAERITVLEQKIDQNSNTIERVVEIMTRGLPKDPPK